MKGIVRWLLVGAAALIASGASAADGDKEGKRKGQFQAHRAGWMLGMYVGEERGQPYPFVLEVAPNSEAKIKGIRAGDELIRLEDEETTPLAKVFERANKLRPGKHIELWVRRGVQTIKVEMRVPKTANAAEEEKESAKKSEKKEGEEGSAAGGDEGKKKKKKKKGPIVIKPIPSEGN